MVNEDPYPNVILTSEQIIEYNPDYIFFVIPGESAKFCSDSAYRTLNAVANNHVYDDPCGLNSWSNAGTESILQFKWAISIFYPDLVDYDIIEETRDFYEQFYGYTPTEQEINDILNVSF
jgi:iron complex transport system substrate-binding protein